MFKVVGLMKRNPGLSMAEFIAYYETTHAKLGEKYLTAKAVRYMRRFLHPLADPFAKTAVTSDYDAILEMWFADEAHWQMTLAGLEDPETNREIVEDEKRVFDRAKNRFFVVEEHESVLG